jgi:exonuclease III
MYPQLRIVSWNIGGNLPIKIREPQYIRLIKGNDILILQETWLRPEEEHTLELPPGFDLIARSRSNGRTMRSSRGGVVAIIRSSITFKVLEELSGPDLIALELDDIFIVGTYIAPSTNNSWQSWSDVHPKTRLAEALAGCSVNREKALTALGDLNARVRNETPAASSLDRASDDDTINSRGRWVLELCDDNRLEILNGTTYDAKSPGPCTSWQPGGEAMVDYALFSRDSLDLLSPGALQVTKVPIEWSDHSILTLLVRLPPRRRATPTCPSLIPSIYDVPPTERPATATLCDVLLNATLDKAQTDDEATLGFYGTVEGTSPRRTRVHVAASCLHQSTHKATTAFGLCWGEQNAHNAGMHTPGRQTETAALLNAILHAVNVATPSRTLEIHTTSK